MIDRTLMQAGPCFVCLGENALYSATIPRLEIRWGGEKRKKRKREKDEYDGLCLNAEIPFVLMERVSSCSSGLVVLIPDTLDQ